jgi:hypothetical protein
MAALAANDPSLKTPVQDFPHDQDTPSTERGHDFRSLRLQSGQLLRTYLAERSVFYLPQTKELETDLRRLKETDRANRSAVYLTLAELAWDRGDNRGCVELGGGFARHSVGRSSGEVGASFRFWHTRPYCGCLRAIGPTRGCDAVVYPRFANQTPEPSGSSDVPKTGYSYG